MGTALGVGAIGGCCFLGARYLNRVHGASRQLQLLIAEVAGKDARVVITGATSGIGEELARQLARHSSVSLMLGCRNVERARFIFPNACVQIVPLELLDLDSVQKFADEAHTFLSDGGEGLRLLVNNAGVMRPPQQQQDIVTKIDPSWQTHFLAPFLLTELIARHRAKREDAILQPLRVVHVGSRLERRSNLDDDLLEEVIAGRPGEKQYGDSKRAMMLWTSLRAESFASKSGMYVHTSTPGMVDTQLGRNSMSPMLWPLTKPFRVILLRSPAEGALAAATVGLQKQATESFGHYNDGSKQLEDLPKERLGEKTFAQQIVKWAAGVTGLEPRWEACGKQ